jgi:phosphatidylglycerophosphatase A
LAEKAVDGSGRDLAVFGIAVLLSMAGMKAATLVERATGVEDPPFVIVDEIVGQLFALIGAPATWKAAVAGFLLFRLFDITKPFPLRRLESFPEGIGIVMDDIGAGLYSLAVLHLLLHFGILP